MKIRSSILFLILVLFSGRGPRACNLTNTLLITVNESPAGTWTFTIRICMGYGRTGASLGADGPTNSISLAVFSSMGEAAIQAALVSFTPTLTIPFDNPPFTSPADFGGQVGAGWGLGEQDNIIYLNSLGNNLTCVSSTANCGNIGSHCQNIVLVYTSIFPDSIRILGLEGGLPTSGCYPNSDMLIDLSVLPVIWGDFSGHSVGEVVNLNWSTRRVSGAAYYKVMRADLSNTFSEIGIVEAEENTGQEIFYQFVDPLPFHGDNFYKIIQVDVDGKEHATEVISVFSIPFVGIRIESVSYDEEIEILPASIFSDQDVSCQFSILNILGETISEFPDQLVRGRNQIDLGRAFLPQGVFFLTVRAGDRKAMEKIMVH